MEKDLILVFIEKNKEQISSAFVWIKEGEQPKEWSNDCIDILINYYKEKKI